MRRLVVLLALGLILGATAPLAQASSPGLVLAQDTETEESSEVGGEESSQQQEGEITGGDEGEDQESGGADEPEAETGAGEDQTEETTTETGPPWTYQMARMSLAALLLLALAIAGAYYKFVVARQRGTA